MCEKLFPIFWGKDLIVGLTGSKSDELFDTNRQMISKMHNATHMDNFQERFPIFLTPWEDILSIFCKYIL